MNSKGFELSINFLVIIIIVIIVSVIIILIFRGQSGGFLAGLQDCQSKEGTCKCLEKGDSCEENFAEYTLNGCEKDIEYCPSTARKVCCVPIENPKIS